MTLELLDSTVFAPSLLAFNWHLVLCIAFTSGRQDDDEDDDSITCRYPHPLSHGSSLLFTLNSSCISSSVSGLILLLPELCPLSISSPTDLLETNSLFHVSESVSIFLECGTLPCFFFSFHFLIPWTTMAANEKLAWWWPFSSQYWDLLALSWYVVHGVFNGFCLKCIHFLKLWVLSPIIFKSSEILSQISLSSC